eukprot:364362-Chlamydomonas_euryale.AAC.23
MHLRKHHVAARPRHCNARSRHRHGWALCYVAAQAASAWDVAATGLKSAAATALDTATTVSTTAATVEAAPATAVPAAASLRRTISVHRLRHPAVANA